MKTKSKTKDKNGFNKEWKKQDNIIHLKSQIESTFYLENYVHIS